MRNYCYAIFTMPIKNSESYTWKLLFFGTNDLDNRKSTWYWMKGSQENFLSNGTLYLYIFICVSWKTERKWMACSLAFYDSNVFCCWVSCVLVDVWNTFIKQNAQFTRTIFIIALLCHVLPVFLAIDAKILFICLYEMTLWVMGSFALMQHCWTFSDRNWESLVLSQFHCD